jgi:lysophospholipase L1-like esterase
MVVANLRGKFPKAAIVVAKILPCHAPGNKFHDDIIKTNAAIDPLKLDSDPKVLLLDMTLDFANADGTLRKALYLPDNIHLSVEGYRVYAGRLKPLFDKALGR